MTKYIDVNDVINISLITTEGKSKILFELKDKLAYYANGDTEHIKDVFYCYYGFTIWSNY